MNASFSPARLEQMLRSRWLLPPALLDELARNPDFAEALRANVGVRECFSLRTHTLWVMDCYEKNFSQRPEAEPRARALFRLFLALHDIGKPRAIDAGDKRFQHRFTVQMMRQTRAFYPVTDSEFDHWIALVDGDPIGGFLKGEISQAEAADGIRRMAARSPRPTDSFFKELLMYYQCDVSAYTSRTNLMGILDGLFEWQEERREIAWDAASGLLRFSEPVRQQLARLTPDVIWGKR